MDEAAINWVEHLLKLLILVGFSAGIGGAVAYWVFTTMGREWFDAKFRARLGKYRHAQETELEQLRLKISNVYNRALQLHQRELEVLPEAWARLTDAAQKTLRLTGPHEYCPDLNTMTIPHLEEFLAQSSLTKWEKEEIKTQADKKQHYINCVLSSQLVEARKHAVDARFYLVRNGIFLPVDLRERFMKLSDMVWEALMEHEHQKDHNDLPRTMSKRDLFHERGEDCLKQLEIAVYHRLWNSQNARSTTQEEKAEAMADRGFTLFIKRLEQKLDMVWPRSRTEGRHK